MRKCIKCFKTRPQPLEYVIDQLRAVRITLTRSFSIYGFDYASSFPTHERTSKITVKSYLCIFVYFVTKIIHLKLATDLFTEIFFELLA